MKYRKIVPKSTNTDDSQDNNYTLFPIIILIMSILFFATFVIGINVLLISYLLNSFNVIKIIPLIIFNLFIIWLSIILLKSRRK